MIIDVTQKNQTVVKERDVSQEDQNAEQVKNQENPVESHVKVLVNQENLKREVVENQEREVQRKHQEREVQRKHQESPEERDQ